jgi:hypothetical protein
LSHWSRSREREPAYSESDLRPLPAAIGPDGTLFHSDPNRRLTLRCELDAAFFYLYGIASDDVDYIMDTFPIVVRNDEQQYGDYRTNLLILGIYDRMQLAITSGRPYHTILDPAPADPRVAHFVRGPAL